MSFSKRVNITQSDPVKVAAIQNIKNLVFYTARFKAILACMEECLFLSSGNAEPKCMMFTGDAGVGKTSTINAFKLEYPRSETGDVTQVPVLVSSIPRPATIQGVVTSMLVSLKSPFPERGTLNSKSARLYALLKSCSVRLIILDEFQHLIESSTPRHVNNVSDWIKTLINQTNIPIVLCGMPSSREILATNVQLLRRFRQQLQLLPFYWHEDEHEFRVMLRALDGKLGLPHTSDLAGDQLAPRLWLASRGNMSNLMYFIQEVATDAILLDAPRLELQQFSDFWSDKYGDECNPFLMTDKEVARALNKVSK